MNRQTVAQLIGAGKKRGAVQALAEVDLTIAAGEVYALLGPNGAGKTTAISLLLGLLRPDSGEARLFGLAPQELAARRRIGVMLQSAGLPDTLTVGELLAQVRSYYAQPRSLADVAALAGIEPLLGTRHARLSGGQQRRVEFALAICGRPELLFLDEPTVGMDTESRGQFWQTIRELVAGGCAVVLTTHYLEEAEALAQRIGVLMLGRLVAEGSLDAIRARVGQRQIRCVSSLSAEQVRAWPLVQSVQREGERLHIVTPQPEPVLRELLAADAQLHDLEVQRAGLAEALQTITREAA
ncbi:MAG: multidrug ABC transporter ATP-binding protein [Lysobacterales bacterium 69-70]|nr:ABC transporter ATP-binding protein [Xanthomonadaceae bacterium]ODU32537.1 MAG: multidrug ABC transporter ATP-binding protein [Xanthomonadaceae bacterium SCN 69-320]ODV19324.1 MAG: multidrug ABC transporter ATP-binding protein [Xanthomonadaceae bacterium SCN 69-25]OJZ00383.1 MAG: multidrug ABC transporter ATP-binding protein [Xanthomonadales bacterium 69-70]